MENCERSVRLFVATISGLFALSLLTNVCVSSIFLWNLRQMDLSKLSEKRHPDFCKIGQTDFCHIVHSNTTICHTGCCYTCPDLEMPSHEIIICESDKDRSRFDTGIICKYNGQIFRSARDASLPLFVEKIKVVQVQVIVVAIATIVGCLAFYYGTKYKPILVLVWLSIYFMFFLIMMHGFTFGEIRTIFEHYETCAYRLKGKCIFPSVYWIGLLLQLVSTAGAVVLVVLWLFAYAINHVLKIGRRWTRKESVISIVSVSKNSGIDDTTIKMPPMVSVELTTATESQYHILIAQVNGAMAVCTILMSLLQCNTQICRVCTRSPICKNDQKYLLYASAFIMFLSALSSFYRSVKCQFDPKADSKLPKILFLSLILEACAGYVALFLFICIEEPILYADYLLIALAIFQVFWLFYLILENTCPAVITHCFNYREKLKAKARKGMSKHRKELLAASYKNGDALIVRNESDGKKYLFVNKVNRVYCKFFVPLDEAFEALILDSDKISSGNQEAVGESLVFTVDVEKSSILENVYI